MPLSRAEFDGGSARCAFDALDERFHYLVDGMSAAAETVIAVILIATAFAARRWLRYPAARDPRHPLRSGVPLARARLALFGLAGLLTATATLTIGPLSFVGLMGPHLAWEAGLTRAMPQMIGASLIGGG